MNFMNSKNTLFTGLMVGLSVTTFAACGNPAAETIQKGVNGGEKAINKARDVQKTVDRTKSTLEQQAKEAEGGTKSP
jgi:hypothetical protein